MEAVLMSASPSLRNMDRPAIHIFRPQNTSISFGMCGLRTICPARPFGGLALLGTTCPPQKGRRGRKLQKCQPLALLELPPEASIHLMLCDLRPPLVSLAIWRLALLRATCPPSKGRAEMPDQSPSKPLAAAKVSAVSMFRSSEHSFCPFGSAIHRVFRDLGSTLSPCPFGGLAFRAAICRPKRKSQHQAAQEAHHEPFPAVRVRPCLVRVRPPGRAGKVLR
jgi:hypothetical protein